MMERKKALFHAVVTWIVMAFILAAVVGLIIGMNWLLDKVFPNNIKAGVILIILLASFAISVHSFFWYRKQTD